MSEKKQLNDEELEKVSGGGGIGVENPNFSGFSGYVDMYGLSVGSEYYFTYRNVRGNYIVWFRAKVLDSYEKDAGWGTTERTHKVEITDTGNGGSGWSIGDTREINGDMYAAYTTKN